MTLGISYFSHIKVGVFWQDGGENLPSPHNCDLYSPQVCEQDSGLQSTKAPEGLSRDPGKSLCILWNQSRHSKDSRMGTVPSRRHCASCVRLPSTGGMGSSREAIRLRAWLPPMLKTQLKTFTGHSSSKIPKGSPVHSYVGWGFHARSQGCKVLSLLLG